MVIEQEIDVNDDGKADFLLHYTPYHNMSGGQKVSVTLKCLNSTIEVAATSYSDRSKICYSQTANYDSVFFNSAGSYNCQANSIAAWIPDYGSSDVHISTNVLLAGDQPNPQLNWNNGTLLLKSEDKSTDMQRRALYQIEKGQWVRAKSEYILFRKNMNGTIHYGWMKLSSEDLFDFTVEEIAYQKI